MDVRLPDGTIIQNVPDGTSRADLVAKLKTNGMAVPADWLDAKPPASVQAGSTLRDLGRQVGLTVRHGAEGLAQAAEIVTEPVRQLVTDPLQRAVTGKATNSEPLSKVTSRMADAVGLPSPQTADERVVGDASRLVAGSLGIAGGARKVASVAAGGVQRVANALAQAPVQQAVSGAGAGLAGGSVRESGGGPGEQFAASLVGAFASPVVGNALARIGGAAAQRFRNALTPAAALDHQVDQQISLNLDRAGVDWGGVSERVKQGLRTDVRNALAGGGDLDPAALERMLQFRLVPGTQPTRGMISQDPVQITNEKNLLKVGANSTDKGLQSLSQLESRNTNALLQTLDGAGAKGAPDAYATGARAVNALQGVVERTRAEIGGLYSAARDSAGRSAQLDPHTFTKTANEALDQANVGSFLTKDIADKMNRIARGEIPLTVDVAEQLKTSIGNLQRGSSDGNVRKALSIVRDAIDNTPLRASPPVNPGNLPAVPGSVPRSAADLGQESIDSFNAARRANREWMARVENTPALKAVVDGVEPDKFVSKFITGQGATVADVKALRDAASNSPEAIQAIKQHLVAHLRRAATGQAEDINRFRADNYNNALDAIGDRKLSAFFSPEEITQLRAVGKASNYMSAQPAGTAVNNSNSGVFTVAKAMDMLDAIAGKVPLFKDTIQGTIRGIQQRQVLQPANALRMDPPPQARGAAINPLMAGALAQPSTQGRPHRAD